MMQTDTTFLNAPDPRAENPAAVFTTLYDRHATAVYRYAFSLTRDPDAAQEVLQDTFLTAWRRREDIVLVSDSILGWLLVTCRHQAANQLRRARVRSSLPWDHPEAVDWERHRADQGQQQAEWVAELDWVMQAIGELNPIDRRLVELCLIQERSYAEAAAELGLTVASATKRISRTRRHLRLQRSTRQQES